MKILVLINILLFLNYGKAAINKQAVYKNTVEPVTIAVIDTGADINHKELKDFIWINDGESGLDANGKDKSKNGIDDDGNGFVDDIHGWSFVDNSQDVTDFIGHGTHISGIIKKEFKKHNRTSPAAVRLMIIKYYNPNAPAKVNALNTVKAIEYAIKMNAKIINYSAGGEDFYSKEFEAIKKAQKNNILFIAAAGNSSLNTDYNKYYPADYNLDNIISVAAVDNEGNLGAFSNYGDKSVDIAAPGTSVYSTLPDNRHGIMTGTSQATAHVTGVAASLMVNSRRPAAVADILGDLLSLSKFNKSLKGKLKFEMAMLPQS